MANPTILEKNPYSNRGFNEFLHVRNVGSATVSPGAILNGAQATGTIAVKGATLGDFVMASYGATLGGCDISAYVSDGDTVTWLITNASGGSVTPAASTTLRVVVFELNQAASPF